MSLACVHASPVHRRQQGPKGVRSVAEHLITLRKVVGSIPTLLAYQQWDTNPVLRGGSPGTEPLQRVMGRRKVGTGEPMTWVGCARPNQTPLVPSAPRCVWGGTTYKVMAYAQLAERTWQLFLFLFLYIRKRAVPALLRSIPRMFCDLACASSCAHTY